MKKKTLFHSFFTDSGLNNLKHALLYSERLVILDESNLVMADDGDSRRDRWMQLIPDHLRNDLESLEKEDIIEIEPPSETEPMVEFFHAIARERAKIPWDRVYEEPEVEPIFRSLNLDLSCQGDVLFANEITVLIAAMHLKMTASNNWNSWVDSRPVFDEIALGWKGLFQALLHAPNFTEEEVGELKAQFLARKVLSLYLPAFAFHSFDDVLEVRDRLESIPRLSAAIRSLSNEIECLPWEEKFEEEVRSAIDRVIKPRVQELNKEAKFSIANLAKNLAGTACVLTFQGVIPDFIEQLLLGFNAISLREAVLRERERVRQVRLENSLSALLEIRNLI